MNGHIILAGDFNQVLDPILDKSKFKTPIMTLDRDSYFVGKLGIN